MATKSGKKGKKAKGKSLPLQEFWAANGGVKTPASSSLVTKTVTSWADEVEEEENYRPPQTFSLPTAPRASRIYDDLSDDPPFSVQIRNLSYDTVEADLVEFFYEQQIVSIVIPEGESGRNRGIAFVEFETKNDLIAAINMPEPSLNNRIIKIDLPQESDNNRRGGRMNNRGNSRYDNFGGSGGEMDNSNWRDGNKNNDDGGGGRRGGGGGGGFGYNRGGERGERNRDPSPEGGNWRLELKDPESPPPMRRGGDRDRGGFNDRNRDDYGRGGDRYGGDRGGRRNYDDRPNDMPAERPKLNLAPRTLPLPEIKIAASDLIKDNDGSESDSREKTEVDPPKPKPTPVPAAAIFGSAKPVDTTAREREIEERMERERSEQIKARELEKEKAAAAASTVTEEKIEKVAEVVDPEANSWRRRTDDDDNAPRTQSPPRRGARRYDDRNDRRGGDRDYNRDRDGGRDGGGSNRDVGNDNRDYNRRDNRDYRDTRNRDHNRDNRGGGGDKYNSNNRGGDRRDHRDNKQYRDDNKPMRREKEAPVPFDDDDTIEKENNDGTAITPTDGVAAVKEARLPKYEAPTKPPKKASHKLPKRWSKYDAFGKQIPGTRFIAFKVPLTRGIFAQPNIAERQLYPEVILERIPNLGLVIDLTQTKRYYDSAIFRSAGVKHYTLAIIGKIVPTINRILSFMKIVNNFLLENAENNKLIGVHCTHGINRTGFLICYYLIKEFNMDPAEAIDRFNVARGHHIERTNYTDYLHGLKQNEKRDERPRKKVIMIKKLQMSNKYEFLDDASDD